MEDKTRRKVIVSTGVAATIGLAGCLDDDEPEQENDSDVQGGSDGPEVGERDPGGEPESDGFDEGDAEEDGDDNDGMEDDEDVEFNQLDTDVEWDFNVENREGTVTLSEGEDVPNAGDLVIEYGRTGSRDRDHYPTPQSIGSSFDFEWDEDQDGRRIQIQWEHDGSTSVLGLETLPEQ